MWREIHQTQKLKYHYVQVPHKHMYIDHVLIRKSVICVTIGSLLSNMSGRGGLMRHPHECSLSLSFQNVIDVQLSKHKMYNGATHTLQLCRIGVLFHMHACIHICMQAWYFNLVAKCNLDDTGDYVNVWKDLPLIGPDLPIHEFWNILDFVVKHRIQTFILYIRYFYWLSRPWCYLTDNSLAPFLG